MSKMGIYSLIYNNTRYIGKSIDIHNRFLQHCNALKNNNHHNYKLQELYIKYNKLPKLEILEEGISNLDILNIREIYWIKHFNSYKQGLNLTIGGDGFSAGEEHPVVISYLFIYIILWFTFWAGMVHI
jgi:group I intron endonuclease